MSEKCEFDNCFSDPEYICNCPGLSVYLCQVHLSVHSLQHPDHHALKNSVILAEKDKKILLTQCLMALRKIQTLKAKIPEIFEINSKRLNEIVVNNHEELRKKELLVFQVVEFLESRDKIVIRKQMSECAMFILKYLNEPYIISSELDTKERKIIEDLNFEMKIQLLTQENSSLKLEIEKFKSEITSKFEEEARRIMLHFDSGKKSREDLIRSLLHEKEMKSLKYTYADSQNLEFIALKHDIARKIESELEKVYLILEEEKKIQKELTQEMNTKADRNLEKQRIKENKNNDKSIQAIKEQIEKSQAEEKVIRNKRDEQFRKMKIKIKKHKDSLKELQIKHNKHIENCNFTEKIESLGSELLKNMKTIEEVKESLKKKNDKLGKTHENFEKIVEEGINQMRKQIQLLRDEFERKNEEEALIMQQSRTENEESVNEIQSELCRKIANMKEEIIDQLKTERCDKKTKEENRKAQFLKELEDLKQDILTKIEKTKDSLQNNIAETRVQLNSLTVNLNTLDSKLQETLPQEGKIAEDSINKIVNAELEKVKIELSSKHLEAIEVFYKLRLQSDEKISSCRLMLENLNSDFIEKIAEIKKTQHIDSLKLQTEVDQIREGLNKYYEESTEAFSLIRKETEEYVISSPKSDIKKVSKTVKKVNKNVDTYTEKFNDINRQIVNEIEELRSKLINNPGYDVEKGDIGNLAQIIREEFREKMEIQDKLIKQELDLLRNTTREYNMDKNALESDQNTEKVHTPSKRFGRIILKLQSDFDLKLENQEKRLKECINAALEVLKIGSRLSINENLRYSRSSITKSPIDLSSVVVELESLQEEVERISRLSGKFLNNLYFCQDNSKLLVEFNPSSFAIVKHEINFPSNRYHLSSICNLPKQKVFIQGGGWYPDSISKTGFIIDMKNKRADPIPVSRIRNSASCVYFRNRVFIFGGYNGENMTESESFDLSLKTWQRLADLPVPSDFTSTAVISNRILITGEHLLHLQLYDTDLDCYESFSTEIELSPFHILIKDGKRILILSGSMVWESTIWNLENWKLHSIGSGIGSTTTCKPVLRGRNAYFNVWKNSVYQFNLDTFEIKVIASG